MKLLSLTKFIFCCRRRIRILFLSHTLLVGIIALEPYEVRAQQVTIKQVAIEANGDVIISYDLLDEKQDRKYSLYLYSSSDNYIQPLEKVSGEVGVDIAVGGNKTITWHAREELGNEFKGGVALELKGRIYIPFITLDGFDDNKVFKRGKEYDIFWTGGREDNVLVFELYQGTEKIYEFDEVGNFGKTTILMPKVKPSKYWFKISDSRNREEIVNTSEFQVKRKMPLAATIGAGVVVLGGAAILIKMLGGSEEDKIGEPPLPTN